MSTASSISRGRPAQFVVEVRTAGCQWLHVDDEPHLESFYRASCGFRTTNAGLLHLT